MAMIGISLSFMFPATKFYLSIPCLVVSGASYGLGVGPVPFILMSSLFTQKRKCLGIPLTQTVKALLVFIQLKVTYFKNENHIQIII